MLQAQAVPPDSVRAVLRSIFKSPAYDWVTRRSPWQYIQSAWNKLQDWMGRLADNHPIGFLALMIVLAIIAVALFTHIGFILKRALRPARPAAEPASGPLPQLHDVAWHLAESIRLAAAGRFPEALGHRFLALILELERRRTVTFRASKTPAEYVREARLDPASHGAFKDLVDLLYAAAFGGRVLSAEEFAAFDRTASELAHHA